MCRGLVLVLVLSGNFNLAIVVLNLFCTYLVLLYIEGLSIFLRVLTCR